jgi:hypothetical protein
LAYQEDIIVLLKAARKKFLKNGTSIAAASGNHASRQIYYGTAKRQNYGKRLA